MGKYEISAERKNSGLADKVIYQLFLRTFTPEGTIKAATEKLDHIASLGVDIVYFVSFCEADPDERQEYWSPRQCKSGRNNPKNPYRICNYEKIDEEYGTAEDFREFVERAHALGMQVMIDLVYLHCGPSIFPEKHPDFVKHDANGEIVYNMYHFPDLDFNNPELREYLWNNMLYWVREFDIDGYRCDVGDDVPLDFWREGRRRIDEIKPSFIMVNEGHKAEYLEDVFDANYDFVWSRVIRNLIKEIESFHDLRRATVGVAAKHPDGALTLRAYENHDLANDSYDNRIDKTEWQNMDASLVVSFLVYGVPFLYNGNEFAESARHTLWSLKGDEFRIDWSTLESEKGQKRMALIKKLIAIRHAEPAIGYGSMEWEKDRLLAMFTREYNSERITVIANFNKFEVDIPTIDGEILICGGVNEANGKCTLAAGGYIAVKQNF